MSRVSYLEQMKQGQQQRRWWPWLAGGALVLVLALGAMVWLLADHGGDGTDKVAAPGATASVAQAVAPTAVTSTMVGDPDGRAACTQLAAASPDDLTALQAIGDQAAKSTDYELAFRASLLREAAADAITAKGTSQAAKIRASAGMAADSLRTACAKAGYVKA